MMGPKVDLLKMKCQTELEARGAAQAGSKQALRQRVRALIIARELRRAASRAAANGSDSDDQ